MQHLTVSEQRGSLVLTSTRGPILQLLKTANIGCLYLSLLLKNSQFTERDWDECKLIIIPKCQQKITNHKHIFRSDILVGKFGQPFKTFRLIKKVPVGQVETYNL